MSKFSGLIRTYAQSENDLRRKREGDYGENVVYILDLIMLYACAALNARRDHTLHFGVDNGAKVLGICVENFRVVEELNEILRRWLTDDHSPRFSRKAAGDDRGGGGGGGSSSAGSGGSGGGGGSSRGRGGGERPMQGTRSKKRKKQAQDKIPSEIR